MVCGMVVIHADGIGKPYCDEWGDNWVEWLLICRNWVVDKWDVDEVEQLTILKGIVEMNEIVVLIVVE